MSKIPNYVFDTDDELYHHGILGQRWGHRRFQNEDGSWTPEGRERYGEGGAKSKSDVQKYKAKVSYNTQKYKADLKSKAQRDKDRRAAKEERNRLKEKHKLDVKQAKLDKKYNKEKEDVSLKNKLVRTKRYAMSDDELSKAIDRLKLEAEYNKQYVLATQPNSALVKADRFFSGPTGKFVSDVAVATIPKVAEAATKTLLNNAIKNSPDHKQEVKDRADRMFGDKANTSSNKSSAPSNESKKETTPKLESNKNRGTTAENIISESAGKPFSPEAYAKEDKERFERLMRINRKRR